MIEDGKIKDLLDQFRLSGKTDVSFLLAESDVCFKNEMSDEENFLYSNVYTEYLQRYKAIKNILKESYGKPVAHDVFAMNFTEFSLSESEKSAMFLSLFVDKHRRFGVMLCQEDDRPLELRLSACIPASITTKQPLEEELKQFIDKFIASKKKENSKLLKESGLLFDVEDIDSIHDEFNQQYATVKKHLKAICGDPVEEDISPYDFSHFLSTEEQFADILTLFNYKTCRFGVYLHQEDKELPIELCITGCRPYRL